ncbi:alpha/beta hydrolase [Streptomyces sp. RB6PN25]|uniref:Alpha/beta hydrolase n=1 Tax=Streptomyces humicola TaxID=2953240 RepID=A0ABT1PY77_9ACTN|nr:alpha/beta hydrolase [Streptomyces humicola]MCQ4082639.1 alpha/beta hydrolase [Streptomyces humicola]
MSDSTADTGKAAAKAVAAAVRPGQPGQQALGLLARAGKQAGFVGAAIGVVAAGAAAGVAVERMTVGREIRRKARLALDAAGPYGTLRGEPGLAVAEDGTALYYETEEIDAGAQGGTNGMHKALGGLFRRGGSDAPLTVVFSHGYCLNQDAWHFQRAALRGHVRAVYWDQRSHGRSERGHAQIDGSPATIDQLGRDLKAVIDAAAPEGPLVLAGHSMGGMTIMALADQFPELVAERVAGVFFAGTSTGKLAAVSLGLPAVGARAFRALAPGLLRALGSQADLVERGRRATADLFAGVVKRYSFGSDDVDPGVARLAERMIESTPIDVVAEFYPAFTEHEKAESLAALDGRPALVMAGDKDLLTPSEHSVAIAERLSACELVVVPDAGHLVMLEYPELVNGHLAALLARVADEVRAPLPDAVRELGAAAASEIAEAAGA